MSLYLERFYQYFEELSADVLVSGVIVLAPSIFEKKEIFIKKATRLGRFLGLNFLFIMH